MKKYIKPETEVIFVNACSMMCISKTDEYGNGIQLTKERETVDFSEEDSWK